ncbi:hypothetical protein F5H01DRAFT_352745 [Linnemannia elongata]|nr:hypothetical protein F5H01DRAFT_352745 [Linnemannia elongata]
MRCNSCWPLIMRIPAGLMLLLPVIAVAVERVVVGRVRLLRLLPVVVLVLLRVLLAVALLVWRLVVLELLLQVVPLLLCFFKDVLFHLLSPRDVLPSSLSSVKAVSLFQYCLFT